MATRDYTLVKSNEGYNSILLIGPSTKQVLLKGMIQFLFICPCTMQVLLKRHCKMPLSLPSHHYGFTSTRDIPKWCEHFRHLSQIISEKEWRCHLQIVTSVANFSANNLTWLWSRPDLIPVSKTTTVSSLQLQTIKSYFHLTKSLQEDEQFNQHWNWWNVQKLCTAECQEKSEVKTYSS
jgi:hypothetical protein